MTNWFQYAGQILAFAEGAVGVRRAPAQSFEPWPADGWSTQDHRSPVPSREQRRRQIGGTWVRVAYVLTDISCVIATGALALLVRFGFSGLDFFLTAQHLTLTSFPWLPHYAGLLVLNASLVVLFCEQQDLYWTPRTRTQAQETFAIIKAVSYASLLTTAFLYLSGTRIVSRLVIAMGYVLSTVALVAWRMAKRRLVIRRVAQGIGARNALIVGGGKVGQALAQYFEANKHLGYQVVGFLDGNHSGDPMMRGRIEDLPRVARALFVDDLFITIPSEREVVKRVASEARRAHLTVKVVPDLYDGLGWCAPFGNIGHFPVMELHGQPIPELGIFFKRALDVLFSGLALLVLSPLLLIVALMIRLDSPGPAMYRSPRVGKKGRVFTCYKFRTMVVDADAQKDALRARNERNGPFFKISDDPRVTRVGRWLRKYSLDELPQFWNVLRGDMSLVGPRPHPTDDYDLYTLDHLRRLDVKPGITGLWQVTARQDPSFATNMSLDLEYIENWSLWLDLKILLKTMPEVIRASGN